MTRRSRPSNTPPQRNARLAFGMLLLAASHRPAFAAPVQATFRIVTDYIERSYSHSDMHPAIQAQISAPIDERWFAGLNASSVHMGGAELELAPYVGVNLPLSEDWHAVASMVGYLYEQDLQGRAGHYVEPTASVQYLDLLSLNAGMAVHAYGYDESVPWVELEARYPLTDVTRLSVKTGFEGTQGLAGADYVYWNAGVTHYWSSHLATDVRYYGSRASGPEDPTAPAPPLLDPLEISDRVAFSISVGF